MRLRRLISNDPFLSIGFVHVMRLQLTLTPATEPAPFSYQQRLTKCLHDWLGRNNPWHDESLSLYGHSFLEGARPRKDHLTFPAGAVWTLGFHRPDMPKRMVDGILERPRAAYGMVVHEVRAVEPPRFGERVRMAINGCVIVRKERPDGTDKHLTHEDPEADERLTEILRRKLEKAGYTGEHLEARVGFDRGYQRARVRLFEVHGIRLKGSECPLIAEGTPEALEFLWTVGAGEMTGSGFGAIK